MESKQALNSADELNIDTYFRESSSKKETVAKESEKDSTPDTQDAPDKKPDKLAKKGRKQKDEPKDDDLKDDLGDDDDLKDVDDDSKDDLGDDDDLDDDDLDDDLDEKANAKKKTTDVSKELSALQKQASNAEMQRAQMQSERDAFKAQVDKANANVDSLTEMVKQLTKKTEQLIKKTEQSNSPDLFTGDDNALMTEGQIKKILEKQSKASRKSDASVEDTEIEGYLTKAEAKRLLDEHIKTTNKSDTKVTQPKIGSDEEAERFWADHQPDAGDVLNYYTENKTNLDPELATVPSIDGRFAVIRAKKIESELRATRKAYKKLKQRLKRMEKGELPETASGDRRNPAPMKDKSSGDALTNFFRT